MTQTVRISPKSDTIIHEMSMMTGKSKVEIIESALETYRHNERMRLFNAGYQALRKSKKKWATEQSERKDLDQTLGDGLEDS